MKGLSFLRLSIGTKSNLLRLANLQTSNLDEFKSNQFSNIDWRRNLDFSLIGESTWPKILTPDLGLDSWWLLLYLDCDFNLIWVNLKILEIFFSLTWLIERKRLLFWIFRLFRLLLWLIFYFFGLIFFLDVRVEEVSFSLGFFGRLRLLLQFDKLGLFKLKFDWF